MDGHHINYACYTAPENGAKAVRGKKSVLSVVLLAAAAGLMVAHLLARAPVERLQQNIIDMAVPVIAWVQTPIDAVEARFGTLSQWTGLRDDNEALRAENERLKEWYQAALMLQSENKALRDLLNVERAQAKSFITTRVITDASSTYAKSLVVEGGRSAGISKGQGVVSREGLIGRIIETGNRTARVLLLQDINSRIPVLIEGSNGRAILAGTNEGMPTLEHLAADVSVSAGQRVITSGLGGLFPYGIPVGETQVMADGSVGVQLYANAARAQHVQVVDYGIHPLLGDAGISSASAERVHDGYEPN